MIIGVDPGFSGGICLLDGRKATLVRMPLLQQKKREYDLGSICKIIRGAAPSTIWFEDVVVIERVTRPASLVRCLGMFEGAAVGIGFPVETVPPSVWKRHFGLSADKQESIDLAHKLYPSTKKGITKKGDDGLAEALLIARWYKETKRGA